MYLAELAASIEENGVLQPVLVRPAEGGYQLIAGECRVRAARRIALERIPAMVRCCDDRTAARLCLLEVPPVLSLVAKMSKGRRE